MTCDIVAMFWMLAMLIQGEVDTWEHRVWGTADVRLRCCDGLRACCQGPSQVIYSDHGDLCFYAVMALLTLNLDTIDNKIQYKSICK